MKCPSKLQLPGIWRVLLIKGCLYLVHLSAGEEGTIPSFLFPFPNPYLRHTRTAPTLLRMALEAQAGPEGELAVLGMPVVLGCAPHPRGRGIFPGGLGGCKVGKRKGDERRTSPSLSQTLQSCCLGSGLGQALPGHGSDSSPSPGVPFSAIALISLLSMGNL